MERDEVDKTSAVGTSDDVETRSAVNSTILDYYKKFGRKRDLEQFFSLSTAQSDIKDTSGLFWRKMKSENDSSDSGGRKSDSAQEVCRISIRCSLPDPSSSQDDDDDQKTKTDSPQTESPPIITEDVPADVSLRHTDEESFNFEDNNSQKSFDALLDLSTHKPLSPTSSITSQRKLEWDSLADVGYANESDRKNSASSLSTLERLALKQQYSNNDSKQDIGQPTSHSTPLDENDSKSKLKKGLGKKTTKIYKKDIDFVEFNVPHSSDKNQAPSINVNLTKHISFNVEKDGGVTIDNVTKEVSVSPEKVPVEPAPYLAMDKEIQTSLTKEKSFEEKPNTMDDIPKPVNPYQKIPVMISLNTLRKRVRKKKYRNLRRKLRTKKQIEVQKDITPQEKSGEQLSEAESFEYMPGHMYHQNQIKDNEPRPDNSTAGNKSSLESSGPLTTDSSKGSNHSITKDLEKCIDALKVTLKKRYDDGIKKKLIKDIVHRLITSKYRDDETTTEFLSGLTFDSNKLGIRDNTTTSTSDANNTEDSANKMPKKSILRREKFNPNVVASTSQSAPNLFRASTEKLKTNLVKAVVSNTDSDVSRKTSSDNAFPKTSSEELYLKYLDALRREEAYKRHLKDKEMFLKQKLVSSETAFKVPVRQDLKISNRLKDLMKDLTRNNYDDGSGDASKLEGGSSSNMNFERFSALRNQRSHSVFTLSSSHSESQKRPNLKKKMQTEREVGEAGPSKSHYCCCPHHYLNLNSKADCADSSVQCNIKECDEEASNDRICRTNPSEYAQTPCQCKKCKIESPRNTRVVPDKKTGEIKYVCYCNRKHESSSEVGDNVMIYKCCKLTNRGVQLEDPGRLGNTGIQCGSTCHSGKDDKIQLIQPPCQMYPGTESSFSDNTSKHARRYSKSSQTNMVVNMCVGMRNYCSSGSEAKNLRGTLTKSILNPDNHQKSYTICEATRCLQTEISINPKISDPTISDINIISNGECAILISENRRKVSIRSSGSEGEKSFSDVYTSSTSDKLLIRSSESVNKEKVNTKLSDEVKDVWNEPSTSFEKDFTIPINGTNMTLTVQNIAGTNMKKDKKVQQVSKGVVTEKISFADESTSAHEENKSTQCSWTIFVDQIGKVEAVEPTVSSKKSSLPKKFSREDNSNTYPKIDSAKDKPPLRRSNTDTGKLAINSYIQTDFTKIQVSNTNDNPTGTGHKVLTRENFSQVEQIEQKDSEEIEKELEFKPLLRSGFSRNSNESEIDDETEKISVGIQKDLNENTPNIPAEEAKSGMYSTKNVGVETEIEAKVDTAISVGCQTEVTETKKNDQETNLETMLDNESKETQEQPETYNYKISFPGNSSKGPVMDMIQEITRRYSKSDKIKMRKNKCFSEIITVLNYLLETEDSTDLEKPCCSTSTDAKSSSNQNKRRSDGDAECCSDKRTDKTDRSGKKSFKDKVGTKASEPCSSDLPATSTDSTACKVLNKIKKECEKYHQKVKCRGRKCEVSSSTSVNCEKCKKTHHCACRNHKCKRNKAFEKLQKKCIAYNLILQTSESMLSEETICEKKGRPLKNVIVKVPKRRGDAKKEGTRREHESSRSSPRCSPRCSKNRSRSCPDECETSDEYARAVEVATVREYLEQNRPDFVEKTSQRQNCLKFISERRTQARYTPSLKMVVVHKPTCPGNVASAPVYCGGVRYERCNTVEPCIPYARDSSSPYDTDTCAPCKSYTPCEQNTCSPCVGTCNPSFDPCTMCQMRKTFANERAAQRGLLSLRVEQQPDLTNLSTDELHELAKQIGLDLRRKKPAPKFISEREMKKHSQMIYKTLPEVVQKKEEKRKENIKKTNLLMANIFKKNLQKQALRGTVNLSNYNTVIKI